MRETLIVLFCVAVAAALEGLFHLGRFLSQRRESELKRRLSLLEAADGAPLGLLRPTRFAASPALDHLVRGLPGAAALERLLAQADSPMTVAQLLTYAGLGVGLGLAVPLSLGAGPGPAVLLATIAGGAPLLAVLNTRTRRSDRMSEQLPEALDMMSRSLRAGHALPAAFRLVASEMPSPVSVEFGRAYEEQQLGLAAEQAVVNMTGRLPANRDLKIFAVSVVVQKETGGNLAEILENIAATIRDRYRFYAKLRALTAEGRASGLVLGFLPVGMMGLLLILNPKYLSKLFDNPMGQLILLYAVVSWLAGGAWMQKMSKVDY